MRTNDDMMSEIAALKALITVTLHKQGFKNEDDILKAMKAINCGDFSEIEDVVSENDKLKKRVDLLEWRLKTIQNLSTKHYIIS